MKTGDEAWPAFWRSHSVLVLVLVVLFIIGAALAQLLWHGSLEVSLLEPRTPGKGSAEAGFAPDTMLHRVHAVQMAEVVRGKASAEETNVLFLQPLIPHCLAVLTAAQVALQRTVRPKAALLGQAIAPLQQAETEGTQTMLQVRGAAPLPDETREPSIVGTQSESEPDSHTTPSPMDHSPHSPIDQESAASIAHGTMQGATVFLVGLVAFVVFVWLRTGHQIVANTQDATNMFVRWIWGLFGLLVVAGVFEIALYGVRASGEPFSLGLFVQALFDTRVGRIWLLRLGLGLLTTVAATRAARSWQRTIWWYALGIGSVLLATLSLTSHAAAEGGSLPYLADWLHVVAVSVWMGGLLGFALLLVGPLRAMSAKQRRRLLWRAVRSFSKVAVLAVAVVISTGAYAVLLHVPSVEGLLNTAYGRVLMLKLGLAILLFIGGAINLILEGSSPFARVLGAELILAIAILAVTGFLTSLPPADAATQSILDSVSH